MNKEDGKYLDKIYFKPDDPFTAIGYFTYEVINDRILFSPTYVCYPRFIYDLIYELLLQGYRI